MNQFVAIFIEPAGLAWTPSPVSVAVLKFVYWSTTVTGDCAVLFCVAQPGIIPFNVCTRDTHADEW